MEMVVVQSEVHPCSVCFMKSKASHNFIGLFLFHSKEDFSHFVGRIRSSSWTSDFRQVSRNKLLPFHLSEDAWKNTKNKVTSVTSQHSFTKDKLGCDQHEPCFGEVMVLGTTVEH